MARSLSRHPKRLEQWYALLAMMVFLMVIIGGVTRLTGSGLSIVEWAPLGGIVPPLSHDDWVRLFDQYKTSPEFQKINTFMDVEGFKSIFWMEYIHRLWGRLIGLLFFVPWFVFWIRGHMPSYHKFLATTIGLLIGAQGALGWFMVKSGLINHPHVSHYRLTAHLMMACLILGLSFWGFLRLRFGRPSHGTPPIMVTMAMTTAIMIALGGMVAGLKAGLLYNSYPLMDGHVIPPDMWSMSPWWINIFDNPTTVQFLHRATGLGLVGIVATAFYQRQGICGKNRYFMMGMDMLMTAILIQFGLGILTLLYQVPIVLGVIHQGWAMVVLLNVIFCVYQARFRVTP